VVFEALPNLALYQQYRQHQVHQPQRGQAEQRYWERCQKQQALPLALQVYFETTKLHPWQGPDQ
jgi:hypothetical protein